MSEVVSSAPVSAPSEGSSSESSSESSAVAQSSEQNGQSNQPQASAKKKFKYKADGNEVEEELDDNEIASRLSLAKAAHKRMQESARILKEKENFEKTLKEKPLDVLTKQDFNGKSFRELAEEFLIQQIEEESLTPQQREQRAKEAKLKEYEAKEQERLKAEEQAKLEQLENHYRAEYEKAIISGLESSALPKNEYTVRRMAELMQKNIQLGLDLEPQYIAQMVKEDYLNEQKALVGGLDGEALVKLFGDDIINKIRKFDLSRFKPTNPQPKQTPKQDEEAIGRMSQREYTEYLKKKWAHTSKE